MVLGALRHGLVDVCNGLQRDAELGDAGLPQADMGGDAAVIGRQRDGACEGLETGVDDVATVGPWPTMTPGLPPWSRGSWRCSPP
jgi:hypothetical protein